MADEVWLIRHAATEWSVSGQHTGRTDVPLLEEGREAARRLPGRLGGHAFARVLVSPLSRARDTADLAGLGADAQVRDDLMEWDYGDYEGLTTPEIRRQRPEWFLWRDGVPHGETPDDVAARVDRVIEEALGVDGDIALFAHGHVLRALAARWLGQDAAFGAHLHLGTAAICVLGWERDVRVIDRWNQT
ncbi:MAG: histidine phosphatase family protein [Actinomycetota bacterium]|nr:histidine phosphatase family protein [Actinomycetota bacterium]